LLKTFYSGLIGRRSEEFKSQPPIPDCISTRKENISRYKQPQQQAPSQTCEVTGINLNLKAQECCGDKKGNLGHCKKRLFDFEITHERIGRW
jgi:hypothetical protein